MKDKFVNVVVLGYGKIAAEVLQYVCQKRDMYAYQVSYIEHEIYPFNQAQKVAEENGVWGRVITDKKQLENSLLEFDEKTLIVSANNNFLFSARLLEKPNITVMNFHNALLPKFPGRNAPSWAIYEKERQTGITWHYVTKEIDAGNIIIQKQCEIGSDTKAYELAAELMELAWKGFRECFTEVVEEKVQALPQPAAANRRLYKSTEVPGNGEFSLTDSPTDIYRLLRALDYGKNSIFPSAETFCEGKKIKVLGYKRITKDSVAEKTGVMNLPMEDGFLKIRYSEV